MADTKITQLTENTSPAGNDLVLIIDDPSGTPVGQKVTITNLLSLAVSNAAYDPSTWNGVTTVAPSKDAVRDQIEEISYYYLIASGGYI